MTSRLREIRMARGLTLAEVAARCRPPTTAVTIGRLETGLRRLTLPWLERLARALDCDPVDLLPGPARSSVPVAALLGADGAVAPQQTMSLPPPIPGGTAIGVVVEVTTGDYRAGDVLWLDQLTPDRFAEALNMDVLVPRPLGRFAFGRLVALDGGRLHVVPPAPGARQLVVADAPWLGRVALLLRRLRP
ncbi:MAG: helix-turn-helix transcriptional regulator [Sphingomonadaceae bacterium]|uniref:helix-turn-helix domain-containing protein n=1 Tax=Thermaurantiacus sp. TaxID=2820283 RepID=UPI00298F3DD7|nr:helix-turn-helix transcriptional regulator [Thermaurantiacus sp.]MCS6987756.1 helix-turn-helix transcriptional regulator [Sphingomonadaceae bacterium]MDW8415024.1 helix-turn-helix transcriptional regulator [Thermaurantiacus sp.]